MKKELPKMYENPIDKDLRNSQLVFSTLEPNTKKEYSQVDNKTPSLTIEQKIYNILHSPSYIYKADVTIILDDGPVKKRIVGKKKDYLITIDNEYIPINKIRNIYQ
ncbi:MAG: hypothetical protein Q4G04_05920 [bacterium]|nr:hypothetical protein [bacterium]